MLTEYDLETLVCASKETLYIAKYTAIAKNFKP